MTEVNADLSANVWKIVVSEGDAVAEGDTLMILESMKMEIPVEAPVSGTVVSISVSAGEPIDEGVLLASIE